MAAWVDSNVANEPKQAPPISTRPTHLPPEPFIFEVIYNELVFNFSTFVPGAPIRISEAPVRNRGTTVTARSW
jgi:hypothetical protein